MKLKARVQDRDDDDPDEAVVIRTPGDPIADWEAADGMTVAGQNPHYDDDEPVVLVAFQHQLDEAFDWQDVPADNIFQAVCDAGIKFYAFPESRLTAIDAATLEGDT